MPQHFVQRHALGRLLLQEPPHEALDVGVDEGREAQLQREDPVDKGHVVRALERWATDHHLVEQHAAAPDVQRVVVALALDHLRRQVVERPAEGGARHAREGAPAEVRNLQDVVVVDEEVLWLEVSVDDGLAVQVLQPAGNLREVVARHALWEAAALTGPEELVQLTLGAVLQQQVDRLGVLEVPIQPEDVLVLQVALHLNLAFDLVDQVPVNDLDLLHGLQREDIAGALEPDTTHDAKRALAQGTTSVSI
mmetsp:Transcript_100481/g.259520  ORF Transcript_100481/g.259520 Transcript_100481/m.259520 type:complete len:251 (-) Transcript_100481:232-984(-)